MGAGRAGHAWFLLLTMLARLLRAGRYSRVRVAHRGDRERVHKRRRFYAPLLVAMGGPLMKLLDTGVRVLPQHEWQQRERRLYERVHGASIRIGTRGTLSLPRLHGKTLAVLLEDPALEPHLRARAIDLAVRALTDFHRLGFTHGDAMAENVMIDLDAGRAHWFDFETVHDLDRPMDWRRADDLRALLATCLLRTSPHDCPATARRIVDAYGDERVSRLLATSYASTRRRALVYHLGQAPLSLHCFREIARLLRERATS